MTTLVSDREPEDCREAALEIDLTAQPAQRIEAWVSKALAGIPLTFEAPSELLDGTAVSAYPMGLEDSTYLHRTTRSRPAFGFRTRYLISAWAATSTAAHKTLARLFFSAQDEAGFEVELTANDPGLWQSFGIPPRPAFFLMLPSLRESVEPVLPQASQPIRLGSSVTVPLFGRVLGPGDLPVARARVGLPSLDQAAHTDDEGRFIFPAVPLEPPIQELRVRAGGVVRVVTLESAPVPGEPVHVRFEP
ncbi:MAG: hypothetical protein AAF604_05425 [Acidobacteriota bacterium]